jgi:MarR family transcriptional regulator, lower aerobic nicotinate degradation pathway regulator
MATSDPVLTSAGYLLLKAGHYMGIDFEATLADLDLTGRSFLVLSFVSAAEGLSQQELSERLGLDPTIVVGLVDELESRGLMTRTRDPADRRRNVLGLTTEGHELHRRAAKAAASAEAEFLDPLDAGEREQLRRLLHTVMVPRLRWLS